MSTPSSTEQANVDPVLPVSFKWGLAVLGVGVAWRLIRWSLQMPIWGDEAMIANNVIGRSWAELLGPLENNQVSPILFLWGQSAMIEWFGTSELSVRFLPTVASIVALLSFFAMAKRHFEPLHAILSTGVLAVTYFAIRHGSEFKPYSLDLLASVCVVAFGLEWIRSGYQRRLLVLGCCAIPVLLGASYPVVFVLGGLVLMVFAGACLRRDKRWMLSSVVIASVLVSCFLAVLLAMVEKQTTTGLQDYWQFAFPPREPLSLLAWLVSIHTGNLFAYPIGGENGGSAFAFLAFVAGAIVLWKQRKCELLVLLLAPFALTLFAAFLQRYPYGGEARVAQHLAPMICILAGLGLSYLLQWSPVWVPWRRVGPQLLLVCFMLIGFGGIGRDLVKPYKTKNALRARAIINSSFDYGVEQIYVHANRIEVAPNFRWYLNCRAGRVVYMGNGADLAGRDKGVTLVFNEVCDLPSSSVALGVPRQHSIVSDDQWSLEIGGVNRARRIVWLASRTPDRIAVEPRSRQ